MQSGIRASGLCLVCAVLLAAPVAAGVTDSAHSPVVHDGGHGQISMFNQTQVAADFYVDGVYQGRALAGGFVTAQVLAGSHRLEAVCTDGRSIQQGADLAEGESLSWSVVEQ